MTTATLSYNAFSSDTSELFDNSKQDKFFSRLLITLLALFFVFGVLVPLLEPAEIPRAVKEQAPVQLTRVLLQEKEKEVPPPPPEIKEEEPEPEDKPKPTKREAAKAKAKSSGLAAMKDDLFSLRDAFVMEPKKGALIKGKGSEAKTVKPNLIAAKANAKSETIASAEIVKTAESGELTSRSTQTVRLAEEELLSEDIIPEGDDARLSNERSEVKLRQTLEANKSRLYSLYNRALRKNPFLKGKVLFDIEIQPSGQVSQVSIQSSELEDKALERRLLSILRSINFGAEDVDVMTTVWAIEFLPR